MLERSGLTSPTGVRPQVPCAVVQRQGHGSGVANAGAAAENPPTVLSGGLVDMIRGQQAQDAAEHAALFSLRPLACSYVL